MMENCCNESYDRDDEKEDAACCNASNDGDAGDDTGGASMDGHADHTERNHHIDSQILSQSRFFTSKKY